MLKRALSEATGTFFLVLVGAGSVVTDVRTGGGLGSGGVALAFGAVVAAMVYVFGRVSGAHLNPAVTIGFWSASRFPGREVVPYVVAQCFGGIAAAFLILVFAGPGGRIGATVPAIPAGDALVVEWLLSFILMFAIAFVALGGGASREVTAVVIGLAVGLDAFLGGSMTGASMNPARSLGPALASGTWEGHWVYWLGPITGMIAAAHSYRLFQRLAGVEPRSARDGRLGVEGPIPESEG
jgi:aquaporin Z